MNTKAGNPNLDQEEAYDGTRCDAVREFGWGMQAASLCAVVVDSDPARIGHVWCGFLL